MKPTIAILALAWLMLSGLRILELPQQVWNWHGCRLAPVVAMTQGTPLYNGPNSGPISSHIYGPVWPIAMLPAALGQSPTSIILIGGVLTVGWFFVPMAILIRRGAGASVSTLLACVACASWALFDRALQGSAYWVHVDAVALGLAALACAGIMSDEAAPGRRAIIASAIAAALAIWTKQTFIPLLIVLPALLWLTHGRRAAMLHFFAQFLAVVVLGGAFFAIFGARNMLFNMVVVPSHHPFKQANVVLAMMDAGTQALIHSAAPVILLYLALMTRRGFALRENPWMVPAIVGLALLPTGLLGYAKVGGHPNNLSNVVYFLLIAAGIAAARQASRRSQGWLIVLAVLGSILSTGDPRSLPPRLRNVQHPWDNPQEVVYRYSRHHPGLVYFPWNTLSTLLAEGRLYHLDWGLVDRRMAGFVPSREHLRAEMPPSVELIAIPPGAPSEATRPPDTEPMQFGELPGFNIYRR